MDFINPVVFVTQKKQKPKKPSVLLKVYLHPYSCRQQAVKDKGGVRLIKQSAGFCRFRYGLCGFSRISVRLRQSWCT